MNRVAGLSVIFLLAFCVNLFAQTETWTKADVQVLCLKYLQDEGYSGSLDDVGDIKFKYEGGVYFIVIDETDLEFIRIVYPNFWEIESAEERQQVYEAASYASGATKVAKVYEVDDNVWASWEILISSPQDITVFFQRALRALRTAVNHFKEKM